MAYAAITSLSQTIHLILNYHQYSISPQLKNQITSVREHIIFLQSFFEDFPDEANTLEERIMEVTTVAEEIIELMVSDSLLEWTVRSSKSKSKKEKCELPYDFDELERVIEEIESIAKGVKESHREAVGGSNDDTMEIISRLRGGSSGLEIIPIVGIGGIGKTTLARNAYDHQFIVKHFNIRSWATVSQDFNMRGIILGLLGSMDMLNAQIRSSSDDELIKSLNNIFWGKRYLIVLDDIWSVKVWHKLGSKIPHNFNGSRVLLTTRLLGVARCVAFQSSIHEMCLMNVHQSWNLLQQKIFKGDPCPPKLECVGKMIARSCRGLPLAIEVVSGILAADQTQATWEDIAGNVKADINSEDDEHLLQMLYLSYAYLPDHLRACFLYLGIFPQDHEIHVSKLIKLWVAEGFLNQSGSKSFEEEGEEYLEDLVRRSLVSIKTRKSNGRIKSFSIHDLVREMCIRQAQVDSFFHVMRFLLTALAMKLQRRVSIFYCDLDFLKNVYGSTIRTIICFDGSRDGIERWFGYFRLLRILDLSNTNEVLNKYDLPHEVFELFHMRYFAFGFAFRIPKAISNFENLQTLIIRPCKNCRIIDKLPVEIWRMRQLRHLIVLSCVLPSREEEEEAAAKFALENLQTLTKAVDFICSRETGNDPKLEKNVRLLYTMERSGRRLSAPQSYISPKT